MFPAQFFIAVVVGYLIGSIPSAYLAGRLLKRQDIRRLGDGNVGAENACKELGPGIGILVAALDMSKGAVAVGLMTAAGFSEGAALAAGAAAVVGHNWSMFLQFRGGRGAATSAGALIVALFPVSLISGLIASALALAGKGTGTAGPLRGRGGFFSGMVFGAAMFIPLPLLAWVFGYSVNLILYSIALPILVGVVHFYQVVLPFYHRTGRLSPRARE